MSYPKRRAAAIAEQLNKQEVEQDEGDDQDDEDDVNFTSEETGAAKKRAAKDPNALPSRRQNT